MGYDLQVPVEDLLACGRSLTFIASEFEGAKDIEEAYADAVGHTKLAGKLHEMATNWKHHREDMLKEINGLATSAATAGKAYKDVDDNLVAVLSGAKK